MNRVLYYRMTRPLLSELNHGLFALIAEGAAIIDRGSDAATEAAVLRNVHEELRAVVREHEQRAPLGPATHRIEQIPAWLGAMHQLVGALHRARQRDRRRA